MKPRSLLTGKSIFFASLICASLHLARVYYHGFIEDPDVSSFILLSQHFWSGDIFYRDFFDPKLPHILPVYTLSLLSGSIAGHLVVTLACICATGWVINLSGKNSWGGAFYICLVLISPGGATGHLAIFANFLISCSYYSITRYRDFKSEGFCRRISYGWLLTSSLLSGWAIGLRPNYGFALIPLSLWFIWQQKLPIKASMVWLSCCIATILAPVLVILKIAGIRLFDFFNLFTSWNSYFYDDIGVRGFASKILEMYSHPIGPINLLSIISIIVASALFSASQEFSPKAWPFIFTLAFLWFSYFISHSYNHYILMDILVASLLISSLKIPSTSILLLTLIASLWVLLILSPSNPHSNADSLMIENRRKILEWVLKAKPRKLVSPTWLTPHWITNSRVPTKGIHPEWSIGLLDRYKFKDTEAAKRFGLVQSWDSQCKIWEDNASTFIGTQEIYDRCHFSNFKEVVQFSTYPLRVWIKQS